MSDSTRFSFSKERLLALPVPESGKRTTYFDTRTNGLQVRVTSTGVKTFCVFRRVKGGQPERVTLGRFPDMTVEHARKAASIVNAEIEGGGSPAAVKRSVREEPTFAEAFELFVVGKRKRDGTGLADRTKKDYRDILGRYLVPIANKKLSQVGRDEMRRIHAKVTKTSSIKANHALLVVSAVFSYLIDQELFAGINPAKGIKTNAVTHRDRFAQAHELPYLLSAIAESEQRDYFLLSLLTGARRSNMQSMSWRDLDLAGGLWRIGKTKNGTPQNVTLSPEAVLVLQARKEEAERAHKARKAKMEAMSPFVFPGIGESGHLVEPKRAWATILRRASLNQLLDRLQAANGMDPAGRQEAEHLLAISSVKAEKLLLKKATASGIDPADYDMSDLRIHDLRRTLGSWQAKTGASLAIIGKSLNHKTHQATAIYARLDLDPVRQSVNAATSAMLEAAGMKPKAEVVPITRPAA
ncbi:MAG: site-specific integrase [Azoarcus sp.]|nr:site-specific integrase [Azoarcus sp.]